MRVTLNEESQSVWQSQNREHLRYEYPDIINGMADTVIDLGAYRGEWAHAMHKAYNCNVIAVEPTDNIYYESDRPFNIINKAAWLNDGKLKVGGAFYYTSAYEDPTHEYECFDINSLLSKYDEIALVKMNIEGAEYKLLNHIIDAGLHRRIRNLQVQFHLIEGEPVEGMYGAIASKLRETHHLSWYYPFCWENWRRT